MVHDIFVISSSCAAPCHHIFTASEKKNTEQERMCNGTGLQLRRNLHQRNLKRMVLKLYPFSSQYFNNLESYSSTSKSRRGEILSQFFSCGFLVSEYLFKWKEKSSNSFHQETLSGHDNFSGTVSMHLSKLFLQIYMKTQLYLIKNHETMKRMNINDHLT